MLRKKVLGVGTYSATLLVEDTERGNELRVLRRVNVSGWSDTDMQQAVGVYNALLKTGPTAFRVTLDSVALQNSFLNVLCEYGADGSVADFVARLKQPLPNSVVVAWLLVAASAALEAQSLGFPHCGITTRNMFLARPQRLEKGGGRGTAAPTPSVIAGLPLPLCCYLQRKREMVGVDGGSLAAAALPPEVLQSDQYDLHKSDVWHVGAVAQDLLRAGGSCSGSGSSSMGGSAEGKVPSEDPAALQRVASLVALVEEMLEPAAARRLSLTDVITSLATIQLEVTASSAGTTTTAAHHAPQQQQQHLTPVRKGRTTGAAAGGGVRPVLDSTAPAASSNGNAVTGGGINAGDAVWQKRAQAQFAELQTLQLQRAAQKAAPAGGGGGEAAVAYQPGGYAASGTSTTSTLHIPLHQHHTVSSQQQQQGSRRHRSPSPQAPHGGGSTTTLVSPRTGGGHHQLHHTHTAAASLQAHHFQASGIASGAGHSEQQPQSPRPARSTSKPRGPGRATGAVAAPQMFEDPAALRRRELIEKDAALKKAKQQEESRAAQQAQKLHQEKMKALQNQRGAAGQMSTEIRKSIRSWQQLSSSSSNVPSATTGGGGGGGSGTVSGGAVSSSGDVVVLNQGGVSVYSKQHNPMAATHGSRGGGAASNSDAMMISSPHSAAGGDDAHATDAAGPAFEDVFVGSSSSRSPPQSYQSTIPPPRLQQYHHQSSSAPSDTVVMVPVRSVSGDRAHEDIPVRHQQQQIRAPISSDAATGSSRRDILVVSSFDCDDVASPSREQSAVAPRPVPAVPTQQQQQQQVPPPNVARELKLSADEPSATSTFSAPFLAFSSKPKLTPPPPQPQPQPQQQQQQHSSRATIGVMATLEWSLDTLSSTLRHLMDPPVFDEMHTLVKEFAAMPASERYSAKANAELLAGLSNLLGDDDALSAAIPLCCQLAALESVWRLSDDLLKMRSGPSSGAAAQAGSH